MNSQEPVWAEVADGNIIIRYRDGRTSIFHDYEAGKAKLAELGIDINNIRRSCSEFPEDGHDD